MQDKRHARLIPGNTEGKKITASATSNFDDRDAAIDIFAMARQRLTDINNWHKIAGSAGAVFQLTDMNGTEVFRAAEKGDHIRIDIPGPGSKAGEGYDWVRIEEVETIGTDDVDGIAIKVRPASNPNTDDTNIAHFYAEQSTSTFVIIRENNQVTASIYDRNIEANEKTKQPVDKMRNALVGLGAKHGFSKLQWQALAEGLLQR